MTYFQILSCNGNLGNCCNDSSMVLILGIFSRFMNILQIIVPILLIISASIEFFKLTMNPEKKGGVSRIKNMFVAAVIVFFIPLFVDVILGMVPQSFSVSACYNRAKSTVESSRTFNFNYMVIDTDKKSTSFMPEAGEYEKGKAKEKGSGSGGNNGNIAPGSAQGILEGAEKVHTMYEQNGWAYYTDLNQLRWGDINYSTNNPSKMTCCATFVGSAFFIGGVFTESEINKFNYNSQYGISDLCQAHGWTKITSYSQLAAGDIVIMSGPNGGTAPGHVQIYAGNGTWYNAGSTQAIQRENPYTSDASARFLYAWRKP